ncbi:MAG: hypothetical protein HY584_01835 [Candidatus Omnitrophica bacterium]|nr:hypothetical protein [Candidatus Omnitrophota bacterium]
MCSFVFFIVLTSVIGNSLLAQTSEADLQSVDRKLVLLQTKMNRLKTIQEEVIQKQVEIKQELDSLKIWIRKNRS